MIHLYVPVKCLSTSASTLRLPFFGLTALRPHPFVLIVLTLSKTSRSPALFMPFIRAVFPIFSLIFSIPIVDVLADLVNVTIDDTLGDALTGEQFTYFPSASWNIGQNCSGCTAHPNPSDIYLNSWHDGTANGVGDPGQILTASVSFTGSALYVFCIVTHSFTSPDGNSDMSFYIDGDLVGTYLSQPTGDDTYDYDVPVYANESMSNGLHTFELVNGAVTGLKSLVMLDYVVYTRDVQLTSPVLASPSPSPTTAVTSSSSTSPSSPPPPPPTFLSSFTFISSSPSVVSTSSLNTDQTHPSSSSSSLLPSNAVAQSATSSSIASTSIPGASSDGSSATASFPTSPSEGSGAALLAHKADMKTRKIGIIVGTVVGALLLLAIIAGIFFWRRRRYRKYGPPADGTARIGENPGSSGWVEGTWTGAEDLPHPSLIPPSSTRNGTGSVGENPLSDGANALAYKLSTSSEQSHTRSDTATSLSHLTRVPIASPSLPNLQESHVFLLPPSSLSRSLSESATTSSAISVMHSRSETATAAPPLPVSSTSSAGINHPYGYSPTRTRNAGMVSSGGGYNSSHSPQTITIPALVAPSTSSSHLPADRMAPIRLEPNRHLGFVDPRTPGTMPTASEPSGVQTSSAEPGASLMPPVSLTWNSDVKDHRRLPSVSTVMEESRPPSYSERG
ncbi:hypothetical protein A0H81_00318 [Grifola frondosa]|uniref:Uncharacterized protein n=1 Tax=Grifola frondosa TaxID=5627 RepID=A0A1C7MSF2_GRIFR|nr:hypothetical protein A0H81_00318 [Grifola frondosa]